jgi:hypothetical protein
MNLARALDRKPKGSNPYTCTLILAYTSVNTWTSIIMHDVTDQPLKLLLAQACMETEFDVVVSAAVTVEKC